MAITATNVANMALRHLGAPQSIVDITTDGTKEANLCKDAIDNARKAFIRSYPWKWAKIRTQVSATAYLAGFEAVGGFCQIRTAAAHGLSTGDYVAIANEEKQGYNGRWKIQVFDADEFFMVDSTWTVDATPTGVWARSNAFGPMFRLAKPTGCLRILREENGEEYLVEGQYLCTDATTLDLLYLQDVTTYDNWDQLGLEAFSVFLAWAIAYALTQSTKVETAQWDKFIQLVKRARHADSTEDSTRNFEDFSWTDVRITGAWVRDPMT